MTSTKKNTTENIKISLNKLNNYLQIDKILILEALKFINTKIKK